MNQDSLRYFDLAYDSIYDGPGHRVVVFFQGCIAKCKWCHSPHSQLYESPLLFNSDQCISCKKCEEVCAMGVHKFLKGIHSVDRDRCQRCGACIEYCPMSSKFRKASVLYLPTKQKGVDEFMESIMPHLELVRNSGGITLSGGEALLQKEASIHILEYCKNEEISTIVETSGLLDDSYYKEIEHLVDEWIFGMRLTTGINPVEHYEKIEHNLELICNMNRKIWIRIPVVPNYTDNYEYLNALSFLMKKYDLKDIIVSPWNIEADHYYKLSGSRELMKWPLAEEVLASEKKIREYLEAMGLNIRDIKKL